MGNAEQVHLQVKHLLKAEMVGECWIDPFCGMESPATLKNDADDAMAADYHIDGLEFLSLLPPLSMDGVLFDPPYSTEQALRKYVPKHNGTAGQGRDCPHRV